MSPVIVEWVTDLLSVGVIEPVSRPVILSRLFVVPKKDLTKGRLIIDRSRLNKLISNQKFRMVTVA